MTLEETLLDLMVRHVAKFIFFQTSSKEFSGVAVVVPT